MNRQDGPGVTTPPRTPVLPGGTRRKRRRGGPLGAGMAQWKGARKAPGSGEASPAASPETPGTREHSTQEAARRLELQAEKLRQTKLQIARQDEERRQRLEAEQRLTLRNQAADTRPAPEAQPAAPEARVTGQPDDGGTPRTETRPGTEATPVTPTPVTPGPGPRPAPETVRPEKIGGGEAPTPAPDQPDAKPTPSRKPTRRPGRTARDGRTRGGRVSSRELIKSVDQETRQDSLAKFRRRRDRERRARQRAMGRDGQRIRVHRDVQIPDAITVQELALRMAEPGSEVVRKLFSLGQITTINDALDGDTAELLVREFGHRPQRVSASDIEIGLGGAEDDPARLQPRAPVVTVMGHVDHGKTSLLDTIRKSDVAAGEAGAITQHIGASHVETGDGSITFLDTPGHAAFSSMRARGASVTDLVVLTVAANDGLMPQTEEAIDHARAAEVPILVAINKIDLDGANPDRVRDDLLRKQVIVEQRGGETLDVEVSAKTGDGIPALLDAITLQASLLDLRANPDRPAEGAVVEARLDRGRGPVATVLVQRGTLRRGDVFVIGNTWGRARTLRDERDRTVDGAGPSMPVEVDGLSGTPEAGDRFVVVETEARAREIAEYRAEKLRKTRVAPLRRRSIDGLGKEDEPEVLAVVVKADVHGSAEAIVEALARIGNDDVRVHVLHAGVGAISESDITLASTTGARVIGFNVRPNAQAKLAATRFDVDISFHSIIYELLDEIRNLASGLLSPEVRETELGRAEILEVFRVSRVGAVAGCRVTSGFARRNARARLLRGGVVLYTGALATLKRFKDDASEVATGNECGMALRNCQDLRQGDVIELFQTEEITRSL